MMSEKKIQNPFYAIFLYAMRHKLRPQRNIIVGERNGGDRNSRLCRPAFSHRFFHGPPYPLHSFKGITAAHFAFANGLCGSHGRSLFGSDALTAKGSLFRAFRTVRVFRHVHDGASFKAVGELR